MSSDVCISSSIRQIMFILKAATTDGGFVCVRETERGRIPKRCQLKTNSSQISPLGVGEGWSQLLIDGKSRIHIKSDILKLQSVDLEFGS